MKARNPDGDFQWADQYGMVEPWALANGDWNQSAVELGIRGKGYWFKEQHPDFGKPQGPPYFRTTYLDRKSFKVDTLSARYGYTTEDLTTNELRKRWIGGGKLKIIDLQTNEVLAERTDYYRATGPGVKMAWASGVSCPPGPKRLTNTSSPEFILAVLKPSNELPTDQQLLQIKGE